MRHLATGPAARLAAVVCAFLSCAGIALAYEPPGLKVDVGLSSRANSGVSISFALSPAEPGSRALPPIRSLRLVDYLGSLDLRGIPTCRPTTGSTSSPGCTTPLIGKGRGYGYQSSTAEGDVTLKLHGTVRLYSGGQRGPISKLYAWVYFPEGGPREAGRSFVVPMTLTRTGPGRTELVARFPQTEGNLFSVGELLMSIRQRVRVAGRSVQVMSVQCPSGASSVQIPAEATFYGGAPPIEAAPNSTCTD